MGERPIPDTVLSEGYHPAVFKAHPNPSVFMNRRNIGRIYR